MDGHISAVSAPENLTLEAARVAHNFSRLNVGLYNAHQLSEWQHLLSFPAYAEATVQRVAAGVCLNSEECSIPVAPTSARYDLSRLGSAAVDEVRHQLDSWLWNQVFYILQLLSMAISLSLPVLALVYYLRRRGCRCFPAAESPLPTVSVPPTAPDTVISIPATPAPQTQELAIFYPPTSAVSPQNARRYAARLLQLERQKQLALQ